MSQLKLPEGYLDDKGRMLGLYTNLPEAEYHAVKGAMSYSGSKEFAKSPAHFKAYLNKEWEINADREKYKAVHLLCLEPELQERIVIKDGRWANGLKAEVEALQRQGKIVLKQADHDDAKEISKEILAHPLAGLILSKSMAEVSLFWIEPVEGTDGVYCKARIDILSIIEAGICIGDLKNFGSLADENLIGTQVARMKYTSQMGWYDLAVLRVFGVKPIRNYWVFVEDAKPFGIKVRSCNQAMLESGLMGITQLLPYYQQCLADDTWPNYAADEIDVALPDWGYATVGE